jgi:hypothetical protein
MADQHPPEWWAERIQDVAVVLLKAPQLAGADWDTCGMCFEVAEHRVASTAYRYVGDGAAVPTPPVMEACDLISDLWDASRAAGSTWDVAVIGLERRTGRVAVDLVGGDDADRWRVTPATIDALPELLRPRPEAFPAD